MLVSNITDARQVEFTSGFCARLYKLHPVNFFEKFNVFFTKNRHLKYVRKLCRAAAIWEWYEIALSMIWFLRQRVGTHEIVHVL